MFGVSGFSTAPFGATPAAGAAAALFTASADGSGVASASLTTYITLAANAIGSGVAAAELTAGVLNAIAANAAGSGVATGALTTSIRMAASAGAAGQVTAALSGGTALGGQVYGSGRGGPTIEEVLAQWEWLEQRLEAQKPKPEEKKPERKAPKPEPMAKAQKAPAPAGYKASEVLRALLSKAR